MPKQPPAPFNFGPGNGQQNTYAPYSGPSGTWTPTMPAYAPRPSAPNPYTQPSWQPAYMDSNGNMIWNPANWGGAINMGPGGTNAAPAGAPAGGGYSGGYTGGWNPGPYNVGSYGWAGEHYGMKQVGSTYSNVQSGRSNGGRNWQDVMWNYNPTPQQIDALAAQVQADRRKGGKGKWFSQVNRAKQLDLLNTLANRGQGLLERSGENAPYSGGDNGGGYNSGQWQNGLVNWSI